MNHTSELYFAHLNELLVYLLMVHICRLLAQCLRQPHRDCGAIVEHHDVMQVIQQDVEMRWMLQDEHLYHIPDLQAIAKKLGQSWLSYMTAIGLV